MSINHATESEHVQTLGPIETSPRLGNAGEGASVRKQSKASLWLLSSAVGRRQETQSKFPGQILALDGNQIAGRHIARSYQTM